MKVLALLITTYTAYKYSKYQMVKTEAAAYRDKQLDYALNKIDDGIKDL